MPQVRPETPLCAVDGAAGRKEMGGEKAKH